MRSLVHLYNMALAELGGEQIPLNISPLEDDTTGRICQNGFPEILDAELAMRSWGFAKKRAALAMVQIAGEGGDIDLSGYSFGYRMPSDCLKPIMVYSQESKRYLHDYDAYYVIQGDMIVCNIYSAHLLYVERVTDPKRWPPYFSSLLKWRLASYLATARNNNMQQKQYCDRNAEIAYSRACQQDKDFDNAREDTSPWAIARGSSYVHRWRS